MAKKILLGGLLLLALLAGTLFYATFYTGLPFTVLKMVMRKHDVKVQGLEGSLASGFRVASLNFDGKDAAVTLENLNMRYGGFSTLVFSRTLLLEDLSAKKMAIQIKKPIDPFTPREPSDEKEKEPSFGGPGTGLKRIVIRNIDLNDISVTTVSGPAILIRNITVKNLEAEGETAHVDRFSFRSNAFEFDAHGLHREGMNFSWKDSIAGSITPALSSKIKKTIRFSVAGGVRNGKAEMKFVSFDNHVTADIKESVISQLMISDLDLTDYFDTDIPVRNLNVDSKNVNPVLAMMGSLPVEKASFRIGNGLFLKKAESDPEAPSLPTFVADTKTGTFMALLTPNSGLWFKVFLLPGSNFRPIGTRNSGTSSRFFILADSSNNSTTKKRKKLPPGKNTSPSSIREITPVHPVLSIVDAGRTNAVIKNCLASRESTVVGEDRGA